MKKYERKSNIIMVMFGFWKGVIRKEKNVKKNYLEKISFDSLIWKYIEKKELNFFKSILSSSI